MKACSPSLWPLSRNASAGGWLRAIAKAAPALVVSLGFTGCSSFNDWSKEPLPVSVSAANYSKLSDEELYARVKIDPINTHPEAPVLSKPAKPIYYLLLPGEVYPNDVTLGTVYRELEISLEQRGYFNAVYQMRAGHMPAQIDYILRVHYGERPWLTPTVRSDRITWGNDGLVSNKYKTNLMSETSFDPRLGLTPQEMGNLHRALAFMQEDFLVGSAWNSFGTNDQLWRDYGDDSREASPFYLFVVEAFKTDDLRVMKKKAPCVWATFIALPADRGQKFSSVLRAMVQTAAPYYGETTHGLQAYEVPPGKVFIGTPVEVPDAQDLPSPSGKNSP